MTSEKNTQHFDLICIGGGSGGIACANAAAALGAKVALIEKHQLGGTCVNLGCVPKKVMWTAADLLHRSHHDLSAYAIASGEPQLDWPALVSKRQSFIQRLNTLYAERLQKNGVHFFAGEARFLAQKTVQVGEHQLQGQHIVIATGGRPLLPDVPGVELGMTSDEFFQLQQLPKSIAIVGSGYIGVELACLLNSFGCQVHLIIRGQRILSHFDSDVAQHLMTQMRQLGIQLHCHHQGSAIIKQGEQLEIHCVNDSPIVGVEKVIWAVGRSPNVESLNLPAVGVTQDDFGYIPTDAFENTNVTGVYAIGDVTGKIALTPVAIAAGRKLARRLFAGEPEAHVNYQTVPTVIFTHPPVASVGLSEEQAVAQYGKASLNIYQSTFFPMYYALHDNPKHKVAMLMKLITLGEQQTIIGCHLIGPQADEMLQGFAVAIKMGATKQDFDETIAIHPTIAEELVTLK